ncbi:oligosaccharide flippase family protein [Arthrobacter sp. BHU FT2]|nr:oligosaccharide flippase family protein [Arthrobacter sp. BHU FT2]
MTASLRRSALVYVTFGFLQRGLSLLLLPFVTRVMTPGDYGAVSVVVAGGSLFGVVFGSALESAVFRWSVRSNKLSNSVLQLAAFYLYLVLPIVALATACVLVALDTEILSISSLIWSLEILACGLMPAVSFLALPMIRAVHDLKRFVLVSSVSIFSLISTKILLVLIFPLGLPGWVLSDFLAAVISFVVSAFLVNIPAGGDARRGIRKLLGFSLPLVPHRVAFWALSSLSRPAMAVVLPLSQVGLFSLGLNFAGVASLILVEINRALLPQYSKETFPAPTKDTRRIARIQIAAALSVPILVGAGVAFASPLLISSDFIEALPIVAILLVAQTMYGLYLIPANYTVQSAGHTKTNWYPSVAGAVFIFLTILLFGDDVGTMGVSFFTIAGYLVMASGATIITKRISLDIAWRRLGLPHVFIGLLPISGILCAWALCSPNTEFRIALGVSSFVVALLALWSAKGILHEE